MRVLPVNISLTLSTSVFKHSTPTGVDACIFGTLGAAQGYSY